MKTFRHLWKYLAEFFLEWETFQIKVVEKSKHTSYFQSFFFFFLENRAVYEIMSKKYGGAREATENMSRALCMLDK
jgi:hypothetical protein